MRYRLRFSRQSVRDIAQVRDFTENQFGPKQREKYRQLIRDVLAEIVADPESIRSRPRPELHLDARTMHLARKGRQASHLFLYRVTGSDFVDIGRLLHDSMDLKKNLAEGWPV